MSWGAVASVATSVVGSALSGGGGGGGGGDTTTTNLPWPELIPYLTGRDSGYTPQTNKPLSSDWLAWHYSTQQGLPVGPAPPMFVDDPRYTGENVYDAPFQYQPMRTNGPGYGQQGGFGAATGAGGLLGGAPGYPSGNGGQGTVPAPAPAPAPEPNKPDSGGLLSPEAIAQAQDIQKWSGLMAMVTQGAEGMGPGGMDALQALQYAQQNPDINNYLDFARQQFGYPSGGDPSAGGAL